MNKCKNCNCNTDNPKFCSRSCSASYGNKVSPKRVAKTIFCKECGVSIGKRTKRTLCDDCKSTKKTVTILPTLTKEQLKSKRAYFQSWRSCISNHARQVLEQQGTKKECWVCGYDIHVEVCHLKSVSEYSENSLIKEINDVRNLRYV